MSVVGKRRQTRCREVHRVKLRSSCSGSRRARVWSAELTHPLDRALDGGKKPPLRSHDCHTVFPRVSVVFAAIRGYVG